MSKARLHIEPPRLALDRVEAAGALGMGTDAFDEHVKPHVPVIRAGRRTLYPVYGLEQWCRDNATVGGRRAA